MPTFKLTIAYDGTDFVGWQVQPNGPSIQGEIQSALASMVGAEVKIVGSGRTDSGVHAAGQVASFSLPNWSHDARVFVDALNTRLPDTIAILQCDQVANGFHAIGDAVSKRYRYQLQTAGPPDPLAHRDRWRLRGNFDAAAFASAAARVVGRRDFASFQAAGAPRSTTVRHVTECGVKKQTDPSGHRQWLSLEVVADGFLYNMVRNIVGTLVEVGRGKHDPTWVDEVIAATDRSAAGPTAPPQGLTLVNVEYP